MLIVTSDTFLLTTVINACTQYELTVITAVAQWMGCDHCPFNT